MKPSTRRQFIRTTATASTAALVSGCDTGSTQPFQGVVDIHQHTNYLDRLDDALIHHQQEMGITKTVLLPSASAMDRPSTHGGSSNGLAARAHGNTACLRLAKSYPDQFAFFANEIPDYEGAQAELEKYLNLGAIGIGEQKFGVECDSPHIEKIAEVARDFEVSVLLHFQHGKYNLGFDRFHRILEKFPSVNFIGHAQTWWGNIDKNHDQPVLYPKGPVTPGGLTDRYLADYENMYGDLSAGSGQNSITRDKEHAADFLMRHRSKLMYGSDCPDQDPNGPKCTGAGTLALVRELVPDQEAQEMILGRNARRIMRL